MAKRTRNRQKTANPTLAQRRLRYRAVLEPVDLWESFTAMPRRLQDLFCQSKYPDPVLEFDATFPSDARHRALRKELEAAFRKAPIDSSAITVRDFFSVVAGLKAVLNGTLGNPDIPETGQRFMRLAEPDLDYWWQHCQSEALDALHRAVITPLVAHSRMDARMLCATIHGEATARGKHAVRLTVGAAEPQVRRVPLDGKVRPMYRVGTANEWTGASWLSWGPAQLAQLGRIAPREDYPVYVQSHALRHLRERVDLPAMAPYLEAWLHQSLREPRIFAWEGDERGERLVEYRIHENRVGYLVVTLLDDLAAVRTFLFLTMDGTPESALLKRKLRLTRRDINWVGLHQMSAFTQTDLRDDPVLRPLLEECGCGHLFKMATSGHAPNPRPLAEELRRYLRMAA